jgi:membrane-bound serine protease (ClpP class)
MMMFRSVWILLLIALLPQAPIAGAQEADIAPVFVLEIDGAIGPGVGDYLTRGIEEAHQAFPRPQLILLTMNTPGGLSSTLRIINQAILASQIPIACFVHPPGSRAASAGTYILYACHIAAMSPATTLGAATPVAIGPPQPPATEDKQTESKPGAMEKKVLNDAIAYIRGLAQLRGRNEEWAELAVREAATLTAEEALAENVIDEVAGSPADLLEQLHGRVIVIDGEELSLNTASARLEFHVPDWRNKFIAIITDPNIAYILLLLGIYGILLEFYSPGIGVGGVVGGIALLLALYAFQLLPVNFAGVALMLLGVGLLIIEAMAPSFGIFGLGGVVAFVVGSIFLLDTDFEPFRIARPVIAAVAVVSAGFIFIVLGSIWRARHGRVVSGREAVLGAEVEVLEEFDGSGNVLMAGEHWQAYSDERLRPGQTAVVTGIDGLQLKVAAKQAEDEDNGGNHV